MSERSIRRRESWRFDVEKKLRTQRRTKRRSTLAKPSTSFEKRQRERAKRERREAKARRKAKRKAAADNDQPAEAKTVEGESEDETSTEQLTEEQAEKHSAQAEEPDVGESKEGARRVAEESYEASKDSE